MELNRKTYRNIFLGVIGCIVLYWILHETERVDSVLSSINNLLSPFVVGAGLAFIANVPLRFFERLLKRISNRGLRRSLAIVITLVAVLLVLSLVFWLLIPQLILTVEAFFSVLPGFISDVQSMITNFLDKHPKIMEYISSLNIDFESIDFASYIEQALSFLGNSITTVLSGAISAIGTITTSLVNAVISIAFAVYCLARKEVLSRQGRMLAYSFLPEHAADQTIRIMRLTNSTFSNFLSGQCVEVCILGTLFAIAMAIFDMPYIPLVSVLIAITAFIPLVGAFVGCALGALFILVDDPSKAFWFVIMFLVIQQIENNLIYPRVVGTSIGLPGMWVLLAVSVGGEVMGVGGMFLMIPLASVVYTLMRELTHNRLNARGIDPEKLREQPPELQSRLINRIKKKHKRSKQPAKTEQIEENKENS